MQLTIARNFRLQGRAGAVMRRAEEIERESPIMVAQSLELAEGLGRKRAQAG